MSKQTSQTYLTKWETVFTHGAEEPPVEAPSGFEAAGEWFPVNMDPSTEKVGWRRPIVEWTDEFVGKKITRPGRRRRKDPSVGL